MQWVDKRRPVNRELLDCDAIEGVLCNVVTSNFLRSVWESRHWFAIKKVRRLMLQSYAVLGRWLIIRCVCCRWLCRSEACITTWTRSSQSQWYESSTHAVY